jgi:hypothetical protein
MKRFRGLWQCFGDVRMEEKLGGQMVFRQEGKRALFYATRGVEVVFLVLQEV